MTKPSKPASVAPRPFSMSAKDFLAGASEEQKKAATATTGDAPSPEEVKDDVDAPPPSIRAPDAPPTGSAGRASTHSRAPAPPTDEKPRKDEHTILMAVPPPAQENTGKNK